MQSTVYSVRMSGRIGERRNGRCQVLGRRLLSSGTKHPMQRCRRLLSLHARTCDHKIVVCRALPLSPGCRQLPALCALQQAPATPIVHRQRRWMETSLPPSGRGPLQAAPTRCASLGRPAPPCTRPTPPAAHAPAFRNAHCPSRALQAAAAAAPPSGDAQQQHAEGGTGGPHAAGQQPGAADGAAAADGQQQPDGAGGAPPAAQHPAAAAAGYVPVPEVVPDNTYMNRESRHMERERAGELTARYITNDGAIESGRLLIGLKNVFSKVRFCGW